MIPFTQKIEAVVIGTSAGGIEALEKILSVLSESYPLPIIIVLHLPAGKPSLLPEVFKHKVKLKVKEAAEKESIKPGIIYFAPPGHHLIIEKNKTFSLTLDEPILFSRPSIDVLFKSAAQTFGESLLGILLTGASEDGAMGLKNIKENGGLVIVQNPTSAEIPVMPAAGLPYASPDCVLSLDQIADFLQNLNPVTPEFSKSSLKENIMSETNKTAKFEILIVDDVKDNLVALKALLERDDVNISQALSGQEALELMMKHDFALALLDVQMPGMNGFELAELMRGSNKTKNIPIIFVTAGAKDQIYVFKGYESGAVDFLRKPLDPHSVKSKVNIFLELSQQKKELKKQVEELKKTKAELEQAIRAREEFMAIATHELRTPLTALKLQAQSRKRNLERGLDSALTTEKLAKMFDADNKQLERLTRLIDDMLDISRISSGKFTINLENFDLCSLIHEVVERNLELFKAAGMQLEINSCDPINGRWDKLRIEQVITNLLTNAIRYGAGKPVKINIRTEHERAVIIIEDQGIGIAEEDLKRIFQRFERVTGTEVSGLGLGLYIVSQIIEAHNGSIKVESHLGTGSAFTIELPLSL
ncbi:MAG: chemotaxis protein CheB [Bacteriovorax sp.]|nr:chemotaxis protein CheB [Bacteriovorax sp.]